MKLSSDAINVIRDRVDMLAVVSEYVQLRGSGHTYMGLCPFHPDKATKSFSLDPEKGVFTCFGCQSSGNIFQFIQKIEGLSFPDAVELIAHRVGVDIGSDALEFAAKRNRATKVRHWSERPAIVEDPEMPHEYWDELAAPLIDAVPKYALSRGITIETAKSWRLGRTPRECWRQINGFPVPYWPTFAYDAKRLVFTIRNRGGRTVGLSGRKLSGDGPKYFHWPHFKRNKYLYGEDRVDPDKDHLIVVEGFIDVLILWQYGYNAVGLMGSAISEPQIQRMIDLLPTFGELYTMTDGDFAGRKAVYGTDDKKHEDGLIHKIKGRVPLYVVDLPNGVDPKGLKMDEVGNLLETAKLY